MAAILTFFTGAKATELPSLSEDDFVGVQAALAEQQQPIVDKVQELFTAQMNESVIYTRADLASCGQIKVSTGDLKPFTNYGIGKPYTYRVSLVDGEGLPTYHVKVAAVVIRKYLGLAADSKPFTELQNQISQGIPRALQVAAVLKQIGDGLDPLPNDLQIQMSLVSLGGQVAFDPQQKGRITFKESSQNSPIEMVIDNEMIEVQEVDGTRIGRFPGQRTISVGMPINGDVTCPVVRRYRPEDLK